MSTSYRTFCEVTRADTRDLHHVASFETQQTLTEGRDLHLSLGGSESYAFSDFTTIKEITVVSPNRSAVDVTLTKSGPTSFTFTVDDAVVIRGASLTGLTITNPSSTDTISVQVIAGGT